MKIAIIGAGFAGLSAAYELTKHNHQITIFEQSPFAGGLAASIKQTLPKEQQPPWDWDLEQFYHHWFTNDYFIFELCKDLGLAEKIITKRPTSAILYNDEIFPFDSALNLLRVPFLSIPDKLKTAKLLAELKYKYNEESSQVFESVTAHEYLLKNLGPNAYSKIWQPLLQGKFKDEYQKINMRWFWARIYKRTPNLCYYQGGFGTFVSDFISILKGKNVEIQLNTRVENIKPINQNNLELKPSNQDSRIFGKVIITTPPPSLTKFFDNLPADYLQKLTSNRGIGAMVLTLSLHHPMTQSTYWLNINTPGWPFLALVDHTNLIPKENYNNEHILYLGDYLPPDHPHMQMSKEELIYKFTPYLKKINPLFSQESIIRSYLFRVPYAQPIVETNHESKILPIETPIPNVYLATMAQVYPWDRGTNYAVEIGKKAAQMINN